MTLIEMLIVLALAMAGETVWAIQQVEIGRSQIFAAQGQLMETLNTGVQRYLNRQATALTQSTPVVSGIADPLNPTVDELIAGKYIQLPRVNPPYWGGQYLVTITKSPAGCVAPNCALQGQLYTSLPVATVGKADVVGAAQIAAGSSGAIGFSAIANSGTITSYSAGWSEPNPLGNTPAALLGLSNVSSNDSVYYRLDGLYPITAPFAGGGQDIDNVNNVNAAGTVNAAAVVTTGNVTVGGNVNVTGSVNAASATLANANALTIGGNAAYYGDGNGAAIRSASGNVYIQTLNGSGPANIAEVQNVTASGTLQAGAIATPGTVCSPNGIAATNADGSGQWLSCLFGEWVPMGGHQIRMAYYSVADGSVVPAPVCPAGGIALMEVDPQTLSVDDTAKVNLGPNIGTGPWTVRITDGSGTSIPGTAVASTYCAY
ncbi:hypothetical protein [Paraburkholderia phenazinium]|uniref:Shufflon protein, N-terminal constant region n=1 Tax=Paraburkholderia phenazinium TaxID=60549 RepID=A0A1N6KYC4_9BURK|nr:hypothetical protein [Paraburkholderia phenazinium]SIO61548.1 hypothetical protein SAMN05444165_5266 [Paraburkholderia phenazinium]